jgi:hypothetical protein
MPAVAVCSSPNGEPIATTHSPTCNWSELPSLTTGSPLALTCSTATSVRSSSPTSSAGSSRWSDSFTRISSASFTTWALVRMVPSEEMTKPEPSERACCCPCGPPGGAPKKRRKKSFIGSSGSIGMPGYMPRCFTFCVVEMFTTAGPASFTSWVNSGSSARALPATRNSDDNNTANTVRTAVMETP